MQHFSFVEEPAQSKPTRMQEQLLNASYFSKNETDEKCSPSRGMGDKRSSYFMARREIILPEVLSGAPVSNRVVGLHTVVAVSMEALRRYVVRMCRIINQP